MVGQNHQHKGERPVAVYCFTQLIQPGKHEEAKNIFEEIRGSRRSEYEASGRRLGIREEKAWFQGLPQGDMAVVNWAIRAALQEFASSDDPFDEWLKERGREIYHFEPSQMLEADEEVIEAEVGQGAITLAHLAGAGQPWFVGHCRSRYCIMCFS
jgi:hypothetical protein